MAGCTRTLALVAFVSCLLMNLQSILISRSTVTGSDAPQSAPMPVPVMSANTGSVAEKSVPVPTSSRNTQQATRALNTKSPDCIDATDLSSGCKAAVSTFIRNRTHGFNVGRTAGLKTITSKLDGLATLAGHQHPVVIDIGAGKYGPEGGIDDSDALMLLGLLCRKNCTVHGVEIHEDKAEQLYAEAARRKSTAPYASRLRVHQVGIGGSTEKLFMYPPGKPSSKNNWKIRRTVPESAKQYAKELSVMTLDEFLKRESLLSPGSVFYMKVDVEGGEPGIMQGAAKALELGVIDFFSFEYSFAWSSVVREISLSGGDRRKRQEKYPDIFSHDGAWNAGPIMPFPEYAEKFPKQTLQAVSQNLSTYGYDTYLIHAEGMGKPPRFVPVHDGFYTPMSELCLHDPFIFQRAEVTDRSDYHLNCWVDAFAVRRGSPKRAFLSQFGALTIAEFPECTCPLEAQAS